MDKSFAFHFILLFEAEIVTDTEKNNFSRAKATVASRYGAISVSPAKHYNTGNRYYTQVGEVCASFIVRLVSGGHHDYNRTNPANCLKNLPNT